MRHLAHIFAQLTEGLAAGGSLLLLTDYDGTLTPLVADPEEAWLPREVRDDLRLLARSPWVCLGILSGRSLSDLRARVGIREAIYAGCHGLELEGPGFSFRHPEAEGQRESIGALACSLTGRLSRFINYASLLGESPRDRSVEANPPGSPYADSDRRGRA